MGRDLRDVIEQVRSLTDIVDLVGGYLPLKRTGQNFSARCPFHDDKSPSFHVSPKRQTFHCFGCQERGSVFDFVMKTERVDFMDALRLLADRAHVTIDVGGFGSEQAGQRSELYRIHEWVQGFFRRSLASPAGAACRDYVRSRGIRPDMAESFGLGFAPDGWTALVSAAHASGFPGEALERSGLALRGTTRPGFYDRFRNRLSFPIRDAQGRVIAFGARTLDGSEPKYLNSPETGIFHKGRTLFGLDQLRQHPRGEPVLVMEGYTDVLMSAQVGVRGAVATLGTAMTPEHARLLGRYSDRIVLVYDGDPPGLLAAERGAMILLKAGHLDVRVAVLPDGEDPCDFFVRRGEAGVPELLDLTTDLTTFLLDRTALHHDLDSLDGRRKAAEDLTRAAAAMEDPVARELVLGRIGERLRVSVASLGERAAVFRERERADRDGRAPRPDGGEAGERENPQRGAGAVPGGKAQAMGDRVALRCVVEAYVNDPRLLVSRPVPDPELIPDLRVRRLVETLFQRGLPDESGIPPTPGQLLDRLPEPELRSLALRALLPPGVELALERRLEDALAYLDNKRRRHEVRALATGVDDADSEQLHELQRRYRAMKGRRAPDADAGATAPPGGEGLP